MTTPIVQSISDEQFADSERLITELERVTSALPSVRAMIARLRAAEADAKRYRFLRDENTAPGFLRNNDRAADYANEHMACGEVMDRLIDSEMESVQCQLPPSPHN